MRTLALIAPMASDDYRKRLLRKVHVRAVGLLCLGFLILLYPVRLVGTKTPVENIEHFRDVRLIRWERRAPRGPASPALSSFRRELDEAGLVLISMSQLEKATAIRKWCRAQQVGSWGSNDDSSEDPLQLLHRQRQGIPGTCRRFAYVFAGALEAAGLHSRVVNASAGLVDASDNHTLVEVWIDELDHWVLMDSMFNATVLVDGRPASLLQVYDVAGVAPGRISMERNGSTTYPTPKVDSSYARLFKHLFYSTSGSLFEGFEVKMFGSRRVKLVHYAGENGQGYPELQKRLSFVLGAASILVGVFRAGCRIRSQFSSRMRMSNRDRASSLRDISILLTDHPGM